MTPLVLTREDATYDGSNYGAHSKRVIAQELGPDVAGLQTRKEFPCATTIFTVLVSKCGKQRLLLHAYTVRVGS